MSAERPVPTRVQNRDGEQEREHRLLWLTAAAGPTLSLLVFVVGLALVRHRCEIISTIARVVLPLAALAATAVLLKLAWSRWKRDESRSRGEEESDRERFMKRFAVFSSVASLILLVTLAAVVLVLDPCIW